VDAVDRKLIGIDLDSDEGKALKEKRAALAANILSDVLKPKLLA
jgi:hypothetical protein